MIEDLDEVEVNRQEELATDNHQEVLVTGNHQEELVIGNHLVQVTGNNNHQIHQPMKIPNISLHDNRDINRNLSAIDVDFTVIYRLDVGLS